MNPAPSAHADVLDVLAQTPAGPSDPCTVRGRLGGKGSVTVTVDGGGYISRYHEIVPLLNSF